MKAELKKLFSNKAVRAATIGGLALLLLVAVWAVFFGSEKKSASAYQPTEAESRLCTVLERIEGVGGVTVLINGEEGSVFVGDGVFYKAEARRVKAVDTTGAGDTYIGAFVTRLSEGASVEQAMDFASAASAITVTRRGAQQSIPVREEVKN